LCKPEVGGSNDTWGDKLNADLFALDAQIKTVVADDVAALMPALSRSRPSRRTIPFWPRTAPARCSTWLLPRALSSAGASPGKWQA
jgi:hypothetical protein